MYKNVNFGAGRLGLRTTHANNRFVKHSYLSLTGVKWNSHMYKKVVFNKLGGGVTAI